MCTVRLNMEDLEMYWTDVTERDGKLIIRLWNNDQLDCEWEGTEEQLCDLVLDTKESQCYSAFEGRTNDRNTTQK